MKSNAALSADYPISKHAESVAYGALLAMLASPLTAAPIAPGDLLVTRSVYQGTASTVSVGQALPGGGTAVVDGSYPFVWSNEGPDPASAYRHRSSSMKSRKRVSWFGLLRSIRLKS